MRLSELMEDPGGKAGPVLVFVAWAVTAVAVVLPLFAAGKTFMFTFFWALVVFFAVLGLIRMGYNACTASRRR